MVLNGLWFLLIARPKSGFKLMLALETKLIGFPRFADCLKSRKGWMAKAGKALFPVRIVLNVSVCVC